MRVHERGECPREALRHERDYANARAELAYEVAELPDRQRRTRSPQRDRITVGTVLSALPVIGDIDEQGIAGANGMRSGGEPGAERVGGRGVYLEAGEGRVDEGQRRAHRRIEDRAVQSPAVRRGVCGAYGEVWCGVRAVGIEDDDPCRRQPAAAQQSGQLDEVLQVRLVVLCRTAAAVDHDDVETVQRYLAAGRAAVSGAAGEGEAQPERYVHWRPRVWSPQLAWRKSSRAGSSTAPAVGCVPFVHSIRR